MVLTLIPAVAFAEGEDLYEHWGADWGKLSSVMSGYSLESETDAFTVSDKDGVRTITLQKDIKAGEYDDTLFVPSDKNIVLDLNGQILDRGIVSNKSSDARYNGHVIKNEGTLTIKDSKPNTEHKFEEFYLSHSGEDNAATNYDACILRLADNGTTIIKGGCITGGFVFDDHYFYYHDSYKGGGGINSYGTLTLEGGNIIGNAVYSNTGRPCGGGICIAEGSFVMNGGTIQGNVAYSESYLSPNGGGLFISRYAEATIANGIISNNLATSLYIDFYSYDCTAGGGVYTDGDLTISGDSEDSVQICYNKVFGPLVENASPYGGGIACDTRRDSSPKYYIKNCIIENNEAAVGGGVFLDAPDAPDSPDALDTTLEMDSFTVSNNIAHDYGGGIAILYGPSAKLINGTITGNEAFYGGGIGNCINLSMESVTITGNKAKYSGGIDNVGLVSINSGTITGNTALVAVGGIGNWYEMHISGQVIVKDNFCNNTYEHGESSINYPVNLATNTPIIIDEATTDSDIYITHANFDTYEHDDGVLTSGFTPNIDAANQPGVFFTYDGPTGDGPTGLYFLGLYSDKELMVIPRSSEGTSEEAPTPNIPTKPFRPFRPKKLIETMYYGSSTPKKEDPIKNAYIDVKEDDYFFDAVKWAVKNNITTGVDADHFDPYNKTTRGQMLTFLWRMAGSPVFEDDQIAFTDISKSDYYYDAVVWGWNIGIINGKSETLFAPNEKVTRGEAVTFIYRYAKVAGGDLPNPFTDIAKDDFYYYPIVWAANNEITSGTSANTFSPASDCTRAQVVTFLYRYNNQYNVAN